MSMSVQGGGVGVLETAQCIMSLQWLPVYANWPGRLVMVSGASCAGKTTAIKFALGQIANCRLLKGVSTRPSRPGDLPGECGPVTGEEFDKIVFRGLQAWEVRVHGARYLTRLGSIVEALRNPGIHIANVAPSVLWELPAEFFVSGRVWPYFFLSPGSDILRQRGLARGDDPASIEERVVTCATWNDWAESQDRIPFRFMKNSGTQEELGESFVKNLRFR